MILYICTTISLVIPGMCYLAGCEAADCISAAATVGGTLLAVSLIVQAVGYTSQIDDIEDIIKYRERKKLFQEEADLLLDEFRQYLLHLYPDLEKELIIGMKPEKVTAYMIQYPELKSSETICKLVDIINNKTARIYAQEHDILHCEKSIRARKRIFGIWVLGRGIPTQ